MPNRIEKKKRQLIDLLVSLQSSDGSFWAYSSTNPHDFSNAIQYKTNFNCALIGSAISGAKNSKLDKINQKLTEFLLGQKNEPYLTWNYWCKEMPEYKTRPYPDDMDDTFCVLAYLFGQGKELTGEEMAKVIRTLTILETVEGGPYKTWLVSEGEKECWKDIDAAVNSNIYYFFQKYFDIDLPNLTDFILNTDLHSQYYYQELPLLYYLSRLNSQAIKRKILPLVKKAKANNIFEHAILSITKKNLGLSGVELHLQKIISSDDDKLIPYAFCIDPAIGGQVYYSGSPALTIAVCLEALTLNQTEEIQRQPNNTDWNIQVRQQLSAMVEGMSADFCNNFFTVYTEVEKINKVVPIIDLPLKLEKNSSIKIDNTKILLDLSLINVLGWMAYTVFDRISDRDTEKAERQLPIGSFALRKLTEIFFTFPNIDNESIAIFNLYMNRMEDINFVENNAEKYDYLKAYQPEDKSLGHLVSVILFMKHLGIKSNSHDWLGTINFFKIYLRVRQLNDDAHDWVVDYNNGKVNFVSWCVVENSKSNKDIDELKLNFWNDYATSEFKKILSLCKEAKGEINKTSIWKDKQFFYDLVVPIEQACQRALAERQKTIEFIDGYYQ